MGAKTIEDLCILAEMADEINADGMTDLPGALRSYLKTARGQIVGELLERLAYQRFLAASQYAEAVARLTREVDGLRNEMQAMTDASLAANKAAIPA
jgi:hypothetical protein